MRSLNFESRSNDLTLPSLTEEAIIYMNPQLLQTDLETLLIPTTKVQTLSIMIVQVM